MEDLKLPIDYLPITRPLEDTTLPDDMWFYENIVIKLLPDIIKLEATGIPIDLSKVKEVENTVNNVIETVQNTLDNNELVNRYLNKQHKEKVDSTIKSLEAKYRTVEDFLKPFDLKNKIHRSFLVNTYLNQIGKQDMTMDEWSKKDLKKLNQIIASKFISDLLENKIQSYMEPTINEAMTKLAEQKATAYNKNKFDSTLNRIQEKADSVKFNPNSPLQKQQFFSMLGIESDNSTKAGSPQWDRKSLEQLNKLLDSMIEKGESNE